jgi:hypothetical protein
LPGRVEDGGSFRDFDGLAVYGDFWHIIVLCSSRSKFVGRFLLRLGDDF